MVAGTSPGPRWARLAVVVLAVLVAVGVALLWPDQSSAPELPNASDAERGKVTAVQRSACQAPNATACQDVQIELLTGPDAGTTTTVHQGESLSEPMADVGDEVRLVKNGSQAGAPAAGIPPYTVTDFERRLPLLWLALAFVAVVLAVARRRGLRALVGLCASIAIVFVFIIPALLSGSAPVAVALVGALAIMLATIVVTHGIGALSLAAILGTTASLGVTIGLGILFVELAHITGLSSDAATLLLAGRDDLSVEGIVLAGLVIGALGVLDDVTVTQASTVLALRRANATLGLVDLYRRALSVGQDHATATVNTLVLAYVGAALPVLLIFGSSNADVGDALNSEPVAAEIVAMLAGSIGLLAAVPVTTFLAALMAVRLTPEELPADAHAHVH